MSKGPVLLWIVMELEWLFLTPTASQDPVVGFLGQSVTLPCHYPSWSQSQHSMCWGKGTCPKSKCNQELVYTDGSRIISRKSEKYSLQGTITRGDVSLTISDTVDGDSGVYCCRIEVPGWFNDVKKTVRLRLRKAPATRRQPPTTKRTTTMSRTTTSLPTTTLYMTTTEEGFPTTVMTTLDSTTGAPPQTQATDSTTGTPPQIQATDSTTGTPPQTQATSVFTTAATTCSPTMPSSFSKETTSQLTTETFTEWSVITPEPETFLPSTDSQRITEASSTDLTLLMSTGSKGWVLPSTSQVMEWKTNNTTIGGSKMTEQMNGSNQNERMNKQKFILIIACCATFMLILTLLLALVLRGKVTETNCLQRNKRLEGAAENKCVLSDTPNGREDEDGLFTL